MLRTGLKLMMEGGKEWAEESIEIGIASEFWGFYSGIWSFWTLATIERTVSLLAYGTQRSMCDISITAMTLWIGSGRPQAGESVWCAKRTALFALEVGPKACLSPHRWRDGTMETTSSSKHALRSLQSRALTLGTPSGSSSMAPL
jgi:hypothetical protein